MDDPTTTVPGEQPTIPDLLPVQSESDLAIQWVRLRGEDWQWRPGIGWMRWTGTEWRLDDAGRHLRDLMELGRNLWRSADDKPRPSVGGAAKTARGAALAAQSRRVSTHGWDADPEVLGLPAGALLDLKSGHVRQGTREDSVTRRCTVAPTDSWTGGVWHRFLTEALPPDDATYAWVQAVMGYAATGHVREHLLLFIYGPGSTGKGTFLSVIADALGDYARRIDPDDLMTGHAAQQHPAWLADLDGRRLAIADELRRGSRWNTGRVKALVSGEPIRARHMRQDFFEVRPCAQVVLAANHAPVLASRDTGLARRLRVLPFSNAPAKPDPHLLANIDRRHVLRWLADGAVRYLNNGLPFEPESVLEATADYADNADPLAEWVETIRGREMPRPALYAEYEHYAEQTGGGGPKTARGLFKTLREDYAADERKVGGVWMIRVPE